MSKDTFWPSDSEVIPAASRAVAWTNTSLAPPSGEMKPKPLEELKNFTVPMVIVIPLRMIVRTDARKAKTSSREVSGPGTRNAGRDWRFFWSSRAGAMHLYQAQYKPEDQKCEQNLTVREGKGRVPPLEPLLSAGRHNRF